MGDGLGGFSSGACNNGEVGVRGELGSLIASFSISSASVLLFFYFTIVSVPRNPNL